MKYCPICEKKAVNWIKTIIKTEEGRNLYFRHWLCNHCRKRFVEVIDDNGNVLHVEVSKSKETVQQTLVG